MTTGGFCFCKGELVECTTGRVQDCNTKQIHICPLDKVEEEPKEKEDNSEYGGFCFCKGELVNCIAGRVQDCNTKQVHSCPLDNDKGNDRDDSKEESEEKIKESMPEDNIEYGGFCFCKGELVNCIAGRVQDCNTKQVHACPLDTKKDDVKTESNESKKSNKKDDSQYGGFCFCKGALVECSTGRVQDCNTKQIHKCPKEE